MDAHLVRPCGRVVSFTRHPGGSRDPGVPRRPAPCEVGPSLSRGQALGPRFRGDDGSFVAPPRSVVPATSATMPAPTTTTVPAPDAAPAPTKTYRDRGSVIAIGIA